MDKLLKGKCIQTVVACFELAFKCFAVERPNLSGWAFGI
ncbi:hypothetical protein M15_17230 [Atrimonas thermophila]